jgi:hypothetical protein
VSIPVRTYPSGVPCWVVAGVSAGTDGVWMTFVAVSDAGAAERAVANAGGTVLASCVCADPEGARFRLAPAGWRLSAELTLSQFAPPSDWS